MNSQQYIQNALRTESCDMKAVAGRMTDKRSIRLNHAAMGMVTESAEFVDALKKMFFYGKQVDTTNLVEELGDLCWYIAIACDELGVSLEQVMDINIRKLQKRFPDKFTEEKALNRNLAEERKTLEQ